jgi:beta-lactamase regulating signal transducer with metallopeptidase domain
MTGWLLTWLWQGVVLTLSVAILLKSRRFNAATRHLVWWAALVALAWLGYQSSPYGGLTPVPVRGSDPNGMSFASEPLLQVHQISPFVVSMLLGVWAGVALVKLVRLVPSLHAVYALRDLCRPFPAAIESRLPLWLDANARGRRRAELMICDELAGATVLGFQRPCIALPTSLVQALRVEDLDQILLHEQAHVERRDDWARLAQALLQAVLWIHPAVPFIGRALNRESEMACDESVIARTGLPKAYARCLLIAAEVRGRIRLAPTVVPALFGSQHDLVRRVDRLIHTKESTRRGVSWLVVVGAACAIGAISVRLNALPLVGEYVDMALPLVASPVVRTVAGLKPVAPASSVAIQSVESIHASAAPPRLASVSPNEPHELHELHEPNEPNEPNKPNEPPELRGVMSPRAFEGAYHQNPTAVESDSSSGWRAAATPGVEIASAARKTSVGIAGAVTRASVSLAKSFR